MTRPATLCVCGAEEYPLEACWCSVCGWQGLHLNRKRHDERCKGTSDSGHDYMKTLKVAGIIALWCVLVFAAVMFAGPVLAEWLA